MTDLLLTGMLNLTGSLKLAANNGKVMAAGKEILVVVGLTGSSQGNGIPVILPPPPAPKPLDDGAEVRIIKSFNDSVMVNTSNGYKHAVALGLTMQGDVLKCWPGMILPSTNNTTMVTINRIAINVKDDTAVTLPNGGTVTFNVSGQWPGI